MMDGLEGLDTFFWGVSLVIVLGIVGIVWVIGVAVRSTRPKLPEPQNYIAPPTTSHTIMATSAPPPPTGLTPQVIADIDQLITSGQRIQAIKLYREHSGLGLKESKDAVDRWHRGE